MCFSGRNRLLAASSQTMDPVPRDRHTEIKMYTFPGETRPCSITCLEALKPGRRKETEHVIKWRKARRGKKRTRVPSLSAIALSVPGRRAGLFPV